MSRWCESYDARAPVLLSCQSSEVRGCDFVMGCDWLSANNRVELDFYHQKVTYHNQFGRKVILKVLPSKTDLKPHTLPPKKASEHSIDLIPNVIPKKHHPYRYYRKFIKGYGLINKPPTYLRKKGSFTWNVEANDAFKQLKRVMASAYILALSDSSQPFVVETDANERGIGVVLMQRVEMDEKLLGLIYEVHYNMGNENRVADALSTVEDDRVEVHTNAITTQIPMWVQKLQASYDGNTLFQTIIQAKVVDAQSYLDYCYKSALGAHYRINGTYQRIKLLLYWPTLKEDIQAWLKECEVSQRSNHDNNPYPGFPSLEGKDSILVVVDRLTKYSHFIPLKHPYSAVSIAKKELFTLSGVSLDMSSAYHPQSDGQTERVKQCLENYLQCSKKGGRNVMISGRNALLKAGRLMKRNDLSHLIEGSAKNGDEIDLTQHNAIEAQLGHKSDQHQFWEITSTFEDQLGQQREDTWTAKN
ncbi:Transposon Ty3-G Gag-Pol polyprotein [Sesamum angolense]|uniref:Transposon Ty3-G Gag-Pol polyprotein n=1 Tax=Sesamum angolense TaxID=2727404 RepID=A0AAE1X7A3_9LAMI|nr:Transposon Ty3-G Gag-Pol polyprotein [Sesamum angolense]